MVKQALVPIQLPGDPTANLHAATKQYVDTKVGGGIGVANNVVVGEITMYAGVGAPVGWLVCDGRSDLLRTEYPDLFSVIGTTYGAVDGTHFSLPDLRVRVPVGAGSGMGVGTSDLLAEGSRSAAWSHAHAHGASVAAAGTGASINGSPANLSVNGAGTGVYTGEANIDHLHGGPVDHQTAGNTTATGNQTRATGGAHGYTGAMDRYAAHAHGIGDPGHAHGVTDNWHVHGVTDPTHAHTPTVNSSTPPQHPYLVINYIIRVYPLQIQSEYIGLVTRVFYTAGAWPARPAVQYVEWIGPTYPPQSTAADTWIVR
jgi:microcystin-dependent protein